MKPECKKMEYERVVIGEFIEGVIEDIQYEKEHKFAYKDNEKISEAVRFKFRLDGYEHLHYSRWMSFSYGEKSSLYSKYLVKLVDGAKPDFDFDIMALKNFPVKTIWSENNDFQNIDNIFPLKEKAKIDAVPPAENEEETGHTSGAAVEDEGDSPF